MPSGDDPNDDFDFAPPTVLDAEVVAELTPDKITAPHATLGSEIDRAFEAGREQGFRAGYGEGHDDAIGALRHVLLMRGLTNEETAHVVLAVRLGLTEI
jgi:hypothetical protein